ncbi:Tm-1-like ATP-binding domain-containing protein [Dyadobacter sandarakinus]|uniref:Tm-1-like ATP-binding domain-containing protein n=1 Tax=Dyadobacter sandarakinus TaxID=2747268 RepID=A0ABX7I2F7_9BACT|nr:Tm-1-like ATP-binding domain-containing protein [Dyadobacter sandarakinus]QRR00266.1 Tm-1-like ATP-binding domain-containing protein [Dyadobacter sandarakinus]
MDLQQKYILIIGCFDTKGSVFAHLRRHVLAQGEQVIMMNTGVYGTTDAFEVQFEAATIATEGDYDLDRLRAERDRGKAIDVMGRGAARVTARLVAEGKIKAVIGMGGGGGTYIALAAMQHVPLGIPKLCLTTLAAKDLSRQVSDKDITLMPSVVDVAGMNHILKMLVEQAAAAICAMANVPVQQDQEVAGCVAISMFGNTTACVDQCTKLLNLEGYEVMAFHATGTGGKTMEALIREGSFDAVLDVTTTELADDLCEGICSAGPERLTAAAEMGIPQVVVPGCLDMVNFAQPDTVPARFRNRQLYSWAPDVTLMRTNPEENSILGERLAGKVSRSEAPAAIVIPQQGISQVDAPGGIFYNPEADTVLFQAIRQHAGSKVKIIEADLHINDPAFAEILVRTLLEIVKK